jgi:hypothetical protein
MDSDDFLVVIQQICAIHALGLSFFDQKQLLNIGNMGIEEPR